MWMCREVFFYGVWYFLYLSCIQLRTSLRRDGFCCFRKAWSISVLWTCPVLHSATNSAGVLATALAVLLVRAWLLLASLSCCSWLLSFVFHISCLYDSPLKLVFGLEETVLHMCFLLYWSHFCWSSVHPQKGAFLYLFSHALFSCWKGPLLTGALR